MENICRLCSISKDLIHMFNEPRARNLNMIRRVIFLATGVEIKETDVVSKMVCHRCCEVAIKLYKYRTNAISNDKLLKEQYGQPYTPPIVNQEEVLYLAAKIASERMTTLNQNENTSNPLNYNNNLSNHSIIESCGNLGILQSRNITTGNENFTNKTFTNQNSSDGTCKHQSVRELYQQYKNIILPDEVCETDVSPVISLNSKEVTDWYLEQASRIQNQLTSTVIKKVPFSVDSSPTDTVPCTVFPTSLSDETEGSRNDTKSSSSANETYSNMLAGDNSVNANMNDFDPSYYNESNASNLNAVSNAMDMNDFAPSSYNETNASTLNVVSNTMVMNYFIPNSYNETVVSNTILNTESRKRGRPPKFPTKQSIDNQYGNEDKLGFVPNSYNENNASTLNVVSNTILNTKSLDQKRKRGRPPRYPQKQYIDNDCDEVMPKKKIRKFGQNMLENQLNKVDLPNQLPNDKTQQKTIFTSSLELLPSESSAVSTTSASSPSSLHFDATPVSPPHSPYLELNAFEPLPASDYDPEGLLLDHADREHIMEAEKTLSVFICLVCNKLCDTEKQLSDHEKVHLRCKFCKMKVGSINALNKHLRTNCYISIVKNSPDLKLTKVDFIPEVVRRYPYAFEGFSSAKDILNSCNFNENEITMKSELDNQLGGYSMLIPITISEREIISLTDESDDEVECMDVDRNERLFTENNENSTSPSETGEKQVIHSLFKKYHCFNSSNPGNIPKHEIKYDNDANFITLDNFFSELDKFRVLVNFQDAPRVSAGFQERSLWTRKTILEKWANQKVIDVRSPYVSYSRTYIKVNNDLLSNNNKQSTNNSFTKTNKLETNQTTVNKPTISKVYSNTNRTLKIETSSSNQPTTTQPFTTSTVTSTVVSSTNTNITQTAPTIALVTNNGIPNHSPQSVNVSTVIPCQTLIVPRTNVVGVQNEDPIHGNKNSLLLLAPASMLQMSGVAYFNTSPQSAQNESPSGEITQKSENSEPLLNAKPIFRVKDLQELTGDSNM